MNSDNLTPLIGMTLPELRDVASGVGLKPFAAKQMAAWLYQRNVSDIDEMTDISKAARQRLKESFCIGREAPKTAACSADGTVKYLFEGAVAAISRLYIFPTKTAPRCVCRLRPDAR